MKFVLLIFYLKFSFAEYSVNESVFETKLVFNVYKRDIYDIKLEKLDSFPNGISYTETDLIVNTTDYKSYIGQIDYSLNANLLIWRSIEPENGLFAVPIDLSNHNLLAIEEKTLLIKLSKSLSTKLSIDWIHNLIYYDLNEKIIVFNASEPQLSYVVIQQKTFETIVDICVNPLDSLIFYGVSDNSVNKKAVIMKASQDGSNQTVLINKDLRDPSALTVDLVLKRLFWIDRLLALFCSTDFNGKDLKVILKSGQLFTSSYYMTIFGDHLYWSTYYLNSVLKTNKYGLNGTQVNYVIKGEMGSEVEAIRIIDESLQPQSINRCLRSNCSHLCLPISEDKYHCVCPLINSNTIRRPITGCKESIQSIKRIEFETQLTTNSEGNYLGEETGILFDNSSLLHSNFSDSNDYLSNDFYTTVEVIKDLIANNSKHPMKTFDVNCYQTSNVLYIVLIISLLLNLILIIGFTLYVYRQRIGERNERIRSQKSITPLKALEFQIISEENYHLINSNPLISKNNFIKEVLDIDHKQ